MRLAIKLVFRSLSLVRSSHRQRLALPPSPEQPTVLINERSQERRKRRKRTLVARLCLVHAAFRAAQLKPATPRLRHDYSILRSPYSERDTLSYAKGTSRPLIVSASTKNAYSFPRASLNARTMPRFAESFALVAQEVIDSETREARDRKSLTIVFVARCAVA